MGWLEMYLFERFKKAFLGDNLYSMERRNQVWSSNKALIDKREVKLSFNAVPNRPLDTWVGGGGKLPEKMEKVLSYNQRTVS